MLGLYGRTTALFIEAEAMFPDVGSKGRRCLIFVADSHLSRKVVIRDGDEVDNSGNQRSQTFSTRLPTFLRRIYVLVPSFVSLEKIGLDGRLPWDLPLTRCTAAVIPALSPH